MNDDLRGDFDLSEGELRMVVSLTLSSLSILFRWQDEVFSSSWRSQGLHCQSGPRDESSRPLQLLAAAEELGL